jgi:imidazolonepropionase-like amidohydrolase
MSILIPDCTIIDGTGREPIERAGLFVKDDRIAWAGPMSDLPSEARDAETVDGGGFLVPGLIDAHVHVCWNGRESVLELIKKERDDLLLEAVSTLRHILASGTTTVRDIGGHKYMEVSLRRAIEAGWIPGPRMRTSGRLICMTGGHGHFAAREADGPNELRKAAREQIKAGADTVKLMATGGAATPGQDVQASQLTLEEMVAAVEAAHAMGRTVADRRSLARPHPV